MLNLVDRRVLAVACVSLLRLLTALLLRIKMFNIFKKQKSFHENVDLIDSSVPCSSAMSKNSANL